MRASLMVALLVGVALAGCTGSVPGTGPEPGSEPQLKRHTLEGASEPDGLEALTFSMLGAIAEGPFVYGAGEPSAWAALDGTLLVAFPGCDQDTTRVGLVDFGPCEHGVVLQSTDDGATWERLNQGADGRYGDDGPAANGDADVATDAAGRVYAANLGSGIQVHAFGAGNWSYLGDVVPETHWADRQWIAASGPGHLITAWMGGPTRGDRQVALNTTFDAGLAWTGVEYVGRDIGWLGSVQFAPDGMTAYVPFTQVEEATPLLVYGRQVFSMQVARTTDGGATWDVIDTGARIESTATGGHWSGVHMAPSLDVTGDGTIVLAWSQDAWPEQTEGAPMQATSVGTALLAIRSDNGGLDWSEPAPLGDAMAIGGSAVDGSPIMPWVVGGEGDRFAVSYLWTQSVGDSDYAGAVWDVRAVVVDDFATGNSTAAGALIEAGVHEGGVCTRGGLCLLTGSDRALLDFFESDLTPDGRLFVTYPMDTATGGKQIVVKAAIQDGGTPLLVPADLAGSAGA